MKKNKEFDAVQEMRKIREKLSIKYWKHPDILKKEMEAIRKKYNIKPTRIYTEETV
ncbi:MAG: hypothetical protein AAB071_01870 [Bacteroidota bacterium]